MKVLSDFSFIERAVIEIWVWLWFLQKVWSADRFASLEWHRIRKFNLKSYITLLILLMLPLQMTFDFTWTYIKYDEGFMVDPLSGTIVAKPAYYYTPEGQIISIWSKENLLLKKITEYILACGFALQTGTLFLMQSFWSHLAGQVGGKTFMRSWEFKFYIGWALISMIAFPVIRGLSEKDIVLVETGPQLIYSIQLFAIFLLGIRNDRRLNNLLVSIQRRNLSTGQEAFVRIHYFIDINKFLTLGTFLTSIGFLVISTDAIGRFNCVTSSKFLMDLFIIHTNLGSLILWVTMTLIIYPRHDAAIWASSSESKKLTQIRVDNR